jgi:hypothetical protein
MLEQEVARDSLMVILHQIMVHYLTEIDSRPQKLNFGFE